MLTRPHIIIFCCVLGVVSFALPAHAADYVIHISVDGLRPDMITTLGKSAVPNFYKFREEGAYTDNARTDYTHTITLPNHSSQITGRPVSGGNGHNYTDNGEPGSKTLHSNKGSYVASAFDVAHDNGKRTGLYTSKTKFSLYDQSFNGTNGASDTTGTDNGKDKIDTYKYIRDTDALANDFANVMQSNPFHYSFVHFAAPDSAGHASGWTVSSNSSYANAVKDVDGALGRIFSAVANSSTLRGNTVIILTADHGGTGKDHSNAGTKEHYTIPFYTWGEGVSRGDLYSINASSRKNPGSGRPSYGDSVQPIRNGDVANLALKLLGLPAVPGSSINTAQNLSLISSGGSSGGTNTTTGTTGTTNTTTGGTTGNTGNTEAQPCNLIQSGASATQGFGVPWNPHSSARELIMSVSCTGQSATLSVGSNLDTQYIYKQVHVWSGSSWQPLTLSGGELLSDTWLTRLASVSIPQNLIGAGQSNYVVAYVCTWIPSGGSGSWKCGCRDTACTQPSWQLQAFRYSVAAIGPSGERRTPVQNGVWGGEEISLTVTAGDDAIAFGCGGGAITEPLLFDENGNFEAAGYTVAGSPVASLDRNDQITRFAVVWRGWTDGKKMRLWTKKSEESGNKNEYELELGKQPHINYCVCLPVDARIATPKGAINIQDVREGMPVYSTNMLGERVIVPVIRTSRVPVQNHEMIHVVLTDSRTLTLSANHPDANGRYIGSLAVGDMLDGSTISSIKFLPYNHDATYDLLPAGETGTYFVDDVLVGSTLFPKTR